MPVVVPHHLTAQHTDKIPTGEHHSSDSNRLVRLDWVLLFIVKGKILY